MEGEEMGGAAIGRAEAGMDLRMSVEGAAGVKVAAGLALGAMGALLIGLPGTALAAAITFNTALPVSEDEFVFREQVVITGTSDTAAGVAEDTTEVTALSILGYGVTPKVSVFGILPLTYLDSEVDGDSQDEFGFGDAELFTRIEVLSFDGPGRTVRLSPLFGVRVPSGEDGATGDGSTDIFGGVIFTAATFDYVIDSQILYTVNTEADGEEAGDTLSFDASFQYRVFPRKVTRETRGFLFAVLETNVTYSDEDRSGGVRDPDTGGVEFFLTPGVQYATQRWIADLAVQIPVADSLGSAEIESDYSVFVSARFNF